MDNEPEIIKRDIPGTLPDEWIFICAAYNIKPGSLFLYIPIKYQGCPAILQFIGVRHYYSVANLMFKSIYPVIPAGNITIYMDRFLYEYRAGAIEIQ